MTNRLMNLDGTKPIMENWDDLNEGFNNTEAELDAAAAISEGIQAEVTAHKDSTAAHAAEHIAYTGPVVGVSNMKAAVDSVKQQLDTAVMAGDSSVAASLASIDVEGVEHPSLKARIDSDVVKLNEQLADNPYRGSLRLLDYLLSGDCTKTTFIGDSITEGQGADGHTIPPSNPVIYSDGTETYREGDYTCRCWANLLREYIGANFPSVQVVNAGIGGKSAKWANAHKANWVNDDEDVVFVMLGTNDRWDSANPEEFKTNLEQFLSYVKARSNLLIVMTATPTLNDDAGYNFGMKEVDRVISQICLENGYPHISHYREALKQVNLKRLQFSAVLETTGSHPLDEGHKIIWQNLQQALGVIDNTIAWEDELDSTFLVRPSGWDVTNSTSITEFAIDKMTLHLVPNDHAAEAGLPEGKGGRLITFRTSEVDTYSWQTYVLYGTTKTYTRTWTSAGWSEWDLVGRQYYEKKGVTMSSPSSLPITDFNDGVTVTLIAMAHPDVTNLPESKGGSLTTYKFIEELTYSYQMYNIYQSNATYRRYWTGAAWSAFVKVSAA